MSFNSEAIVTKLRVQLHDRPGIDFDTPPSYPMFAVGHTSKNAGIKNASTTCFPGYNVMIPPTYHSPNFLSHHPMHYDFPSSSHLRNVPSLCDFLHDLDKEQGENGVFEAFEPSFQKERIKVEHIKDLADSQFAQLGIDKIGWKIALRQASQRYK